MSEISHGQMDMPAKKTGPIGNAAEQAAHVAMIFALKALIIGKRTENKIGRRDTMNAIYDGLFRLVALLVYSASVLTITMSIYLWGM